MMKLNSLFILVAIFFTQSCNMSAKNKKETNNMASTKGEVVKLDKANFLAKIFNYEKNKEEWIYKGSKPCIIDFYADWCGPCKKISPILNDLAKKYSEDIIIYKVDVDKEKELAAAFGVQSIPTLLFVPSEGLPMVSMGTLSRDQFEQQINEFLLLQNNQ